MNVEKISISLRPEHLTMLDALADQLKPLNVSRSQLIQASIEYYYQHMQK